HELTFRGTLERAGLNPYLYEHANIREQVSWCSKSDPAGATRKAVSLVAAAVAKARLLEELAPIRVDAVKRVAVIGGGVSGLRVARELAGRGIAVTLLERSPFLGGRMAQMDTLYPTDESARRLLHGLLEKVTVDPAVEIFTNAHIENISGCIGNFQVKVRLEPRGITDEFDPGKAYAAMAVCPERAANEFNRFLDTRKALYMPYPECYPKLPAIDWKTCTRCGACKVLTGGRGIDLEQRPEEMTLSAGAIVIATGYDHYQPAQGEYGFGKSSRIITSPQLMRMLDKEGPTGGRLEIAGRPVRSVCLIHCVGSRQVEGRDPAGPDGRVNDYCSRVCCTTTLKAARDIKTRFPSIRVYDLYQDIRTYGRNHEEYYEKSSELGVTFFRWDGDCPPVVEVPGGDAAVTVKVKDILTFGEELEISADLVVLATGFVPRDIGDLVEMMKLPRSADGFLQEVHPKLRPVELAVGGVMVAGTCQAPMDITESTAAAAAAAVKASGLLVKGYIEMDPFVAVVNPALCTGGEDCGAVCVTECSAMQAITIVERVTGGAPAKIAEINRALCHGCGACVAVCPHEALQVAGWRLDQFDAMVAAIASLP
ncbi:CoB--CoM heterodisulfide reductase iron-sulfur subunit A family protein, partial [bacterium]|nr:CoB--CoM heterodisulfide reductase iron-sulfur subunit A family protein [candidate division CSSED10-310 bacterium]